ncbi:MAG: MFS transporter [Dehalococcoidia bacterium]
MTRSVEGNRGTGHTDSAFAIPNVRLYLAGQGLSNIGTFFQVIGLSLLVLHVTGSGFALGATMSLGALPFLTLGPWAGVLIDRAQIRLLLIATASLAGLQALILGVVISTGHVNIWWLLALTFLLGFVQIFDRPAAQAFLNELVPREKLPSAIALASSAQSVGRLGGPAIAALVYASFGAAWCFYVNAASYMAVVIALLLLRRSELIPRARRSRASGQFREGLRFVWRSPLHRSTLISNAVIGCLAFNFPLFYSSLVTQDFHAGSLAFGIAESLNAVTAVLGGIILTRSPRRPSRRGFALGCFALGVSLAWSAASPTVGIFYASMLYFGVAVVYYSTASQGLIQQNTPPDLIGRVMSFFTLGLMGTTPLGGLIVGWVIDAYDPRAALALGAASLFICGGAMFVLARRATASEGRGRVDLYS